MASNVETQIHSKLCVFLDFSASIDICKFDCMYAEQQCHAGAKDFEANSNFNLHRLSGLCKPRVGGLQVPLHSERLNSIEVFDWLV